MERVQCDQPAIRWLVSLLKRQSHQGLSIDLCYWKVGVSQQQCLDTVGSTHGVHPASTAALFTNPLYKCRSGHRADQSTQLWYRSSLVGTHMLYPPYNLIPRNPSSIHPFLLLLRHDQPAKPLFAAQEGVHTHPSSGCFSLPALPATVHCSQHCTWEHFSILLSFMGAPREAVG